MIHTIRKNKRLIKVATLLITCVILFAPVFVPTTAAAENPVEQLDLSCFTLTNFTVSGCAANAIYYMVTNPSNALVGMSGTLFDVMLQATLSRDILAHPAIATSWKVVRDIFNIVFIFILLIISLGFILRTGYGQKQLLVNVIIAALLVNFSLVMARSVIDVSNIIALQFHNSIEISGTGGAAYAAKLFGVASDVPYKPVSLYFASAFNPQSLLSENTFKDFVTSENKGPMAIILFLSVATINVITAYAFLIGSILLIIRTVMLVFLMIVAPIAFVAYILPASRGVATNWWQHLVSQAFVAPVFLFFIYIILALVVKGKLFEIATSST